MPEWRNSGNSQVRWNSSPHLPSLCISQLFSPFVLDINAVLDKLITPGLPVSPKKEVYTIVRCPSFPYCRAQLVYGSCKIDFSAALECDFALTALFYCNPLNSWLWLSCWINQSKTNSCAITYYHTFCSWRQSSLVFTSWVIVNAPLHEAYLHMQCQNPYTQSNFILDVAN